MNKLIKGNGFKIIGNLPYYITSPIVRKVLEYRGQIESFTVMVQKEVAQRMTAQPATKEYGLLTVGVQYYAEVFYSGAVPRSAFSGRSRKWSRPWADTVPYREPPVEVDSEEFFFKVARAAFGQRRKMLGNALKGVRMRAEHERKECGRCNRSGRDRPKRRGETLSLSELARLSNYLYRA